MVRSRAIEKTGSARVCISLLSAGIMQEKGTEGETKRVKEEE